MDAGIVISAEKLQGAPEVVRTWLAAAMGFSPSTTLRDMQDGTEFGLAQLTDEQVREFLAKPMKAETRELLRAAAELSPRFRWGDLAEKVGCPIDDDAQVRGALTGLLKRTRSITGNPKAWLFAWPNWDDLPWEEAVGQMHPETHAAFRRAFDIRG